MPILNSQDARRFAPGLNRTPPGSAISNARMPNLPAQARAASLIRGGMAVRGISGIGATFACPPNAMCAPPPGSTPVCPAGSHMISSDPLICSGLMPSDPLPPGGTPGPIMPCPQGQYLVGWTNSMPSNPICSGSPTTGGGGTGSGGSGGSGGAPAPDPTTTTSTGMSTNTWLLIGGAAVAAFLLLKK